MFRDSVPRPMHGRDQKVLLPRSCSGTRSAANALSKLHGILLTAKPLKADGLFLQPSQQCCSGRWTWKINQSIPIVAEIEQIADRRNLRLKSRARISDGSQRRFFVAHGKNLRCWIKTL